MSRHYVLTNNGHIINFAEDGYKLLPEKSRKSFESLGNHFLTRKEAENWKKQLKALERLRAKGFRYTGFCYTELTDKANLSISATVDNENIQDDLETLFGDKSNG